jgi:ribosomal protein L29
MEMKELDGKNLGELCGLLGEKKKQYFFLRLQMRTMQGFKPHIIKETRRDIARIKTRISHMTLTEAV